MAWPELVVAIIVGALVVLAMEAALLNGLAGYNRGAAFFWFMTAALLDLWAALRLIDWLAAGPARRRKWRILGFRP